MQEDTKHLYEGMYVLNAIISEDLRNKTFDKIKEGITRRGGTIHKIHDQGKRSLAYEINSQKEGYYYLVYFDATPDAMKDMWREYRLNEYLLRFLTLRTDEVLEELKFKKLPEQ